MKKLLSIVLSVCMLLSITAGIDYSAYADGFTPRLSSPSKTGYYAAYDNNCCTYAKCRASEILGYNVYIGNNGPGGYYDYCKSTGAFPVGTMPKVGGLAVASDHIFVIEEINGNTLTISEGHSYTEVSGSSYFNIDYGRDKGATDGTWFDNRKITYNTSTGVPNSNVIGTWKGYIYIYNGSTSGSTGETITPTISDDKNYVVVGENITFTYSGLSVCSKASFFFEKDGEVYYSYDSTSSRTFTTYFEKPGVYYVFSGGYINGNWYYSDKIRVDVFEPKLVVNKNTVKQKELLTFTYSGLTSCGRVIICFEKDGKVYYTDDVTANVDYKTYFENTGVYYVYVVGYISNYSCKSNKVKVTVNCSHQTTITIPSVKPTCVKAGKSEGKKCSECGTVLTYQSTILATGHTYSNACDTTCNTCGATRTTSHSYNSGKITKQATCTSTGTKTYTCTVCGATKTSTISAKGHTIVTDNAIAPTTTSTGLTKGSHCSDCGEVLVAQTVVAKLSAPASAPTIKKVSVPKITLNSVKSKKPKQITVNWKKNTKVTGYEVQYSTDKNFKKSAKKVTIKKNKTTSATIKKLKGKKKYYVRIRSYKTVNGKKYYSSWSSVKSVTTKK